MVLEEGDEPKWDRRRAQLLSLQCADLHAIKCRHKVGSDLSHFLFGRLTRDIGFVGLKDVLQCAAILGRATLPEQLDGKRWARQQD
jgi:hypothetical protein